MLVLFWNIRGLGNDVARNMLYEIRRAYNPDIIAIAEPKVLVTDLNPRYWRGLRMSFLDENSRGNGRRPNLWVVYSCSLPRPPEVTLKTDQLLVIKVSSIRGDSFYGFVHTANSYI